MLEIFYNLKIIGVILAYQHIQIKQGQKVVHKNVSQGCNLIKRL